MTTDDDMREIEAALDSYGAACFLEVGDGTIECIDRTKERREKVLALIRQKLDVAQKPATSEHPAADVAQNDAAHELERMRTRRR